MSDEFKTFKALGMLLCYPEKDWICHGDDLVSLFREENLLNDDELMGVRHLVKHLSEGDILDLQEEYTSTFDRIPSLALYLFEHVHADSKDRGQAMVDLLQMYENDGFLLESNDLPDYLPVFLEYLSFLPPDDALETLNHPADIFAALEKRLEGNVYRSVFSVLARLGHAKSLHAEVAKPLSLEEVDREWEEKQVTFQNSEAPSCGTSCHGCS